MKTNWEYISFINFRFCFLKNTGIIFSSSSRGQVDTLLTHPIEGYFCELPRKHPILQNTPIKPYKTIIL